MNQWKSLKSDPPSQEQTRYGFFVGHSEGGRIDYVFLWPGFNGKMAFWCKGEHGNYELADYEPDVWYPGPPAIPNSWVDRLNKERME